MQLLQQTLHRAWRTSLASDKTPGILLLLCTGFSLLMANSAVGPAYTALWHSQIAGMSLEHWISDALMALFFLFVGLELERELYCGALSDVRSALLPVVAAAGGIAVPALVHFSLNAGLPTQPGAGIPMATDIAFALGVLALLGSRIPSSLKIFLTALAVIDDLGAILVIALFYTSQFSLPYLLGALAVFCLLLMLNRVWRVMALLPYLAGGALMWYLTLRSGVHATLAGVLLAFAIPFSSAIAGQQSPSYCLEHWLHKPVSFVILPLFALANTGIVIHPGWQHDLLSPDSSGIMAGLILGKPVGILALSVLAVVCGLCRLPPGLRWHHIAGAGLLGGIGFTMSIFIANLAFAGNTILIDNAKIAILAASLVAGTLGFVWLFCVSTAPPGPHYRPHPRPDLPGLTRMPQAPVMQVSFFSQENVRIVTDSSQSRALLCFYNNLPHRSGSSCSFPPVCR